MSLQMQTKKRKILASKLQPVKTFKGEKYYFTGDTIIAPCKA